MTSQKKKKTVYHCTRVWSTEFILKQPCQFFVITFFRHSSSNSMSIPVKCAWYLHSLLIFFLICFELLITDPLSRRLSYREWTVLSLFFSVHIALFCLLCELTISMHRSNNIKNVSEVWEFIGMCLCFQFNICQKNCASPKTDFDLMTCKL